MEVKKDILSNEMKYRFSEFTHAAYQSYIEQIRSKGYNFSFFHNFEKDTKFVLWRHDVDFSPMRALKLARIEATIGVRSTYFIQPHCKFYHLLEHRVFDIFKEIDEMGHELALHFDIGFYDQVNEKCIEEILANEKHLIDSFFGTDIKAFSFHNPTEFALNWKQESSAGMLNTYSSWFQDNVRYGSDSNGIWRNESFKEIIDSNPENLQLLSHPVWWTEDITSPKERVLSCIDGRAKANLESQLKIWQKWGRDFIDH